MGKARRSVTGVAEAAADAVAAVLSVVPRSASAATDEELLAAVQVVAELSRVAQTSMAVLAEEVATRSCVVQGTETLASRLGQRDAVGVLQFAGRMSQAAAKRFLVVGDAIADRDTLTGAPLPPRWEHLADAAFTGRLDAEAVVPIVRQLEEVKHRANPELLAAAEAGMARIAAVNTPEHTRAEMRVWKEALDPDGARPREEAQRRARFFRIGRENTDGMTPVHGLLTPDAAAHLRAAVSTFTNPRSKPAFQPADEPALVDGQELPAGVSVRDLDPRSRDQKLHDILDGLVTAGHQTATRNNSSSGGDMNSAVDANDANDANGTNGANSTNGGSGTVGTNGTNGTSGANGTSGGSGGSGSVGGGRRSMTQLIATITLEDLRRGEGVAWVNGMTEPLGPVTVERIVCDQGYRLLVEGDQGEPLWLGTKTQMFTPAQKLAITARDGTCDWPGCDIPADWCEVHHIQYRRDGGPTNIDNGLIMCSAHHHMIHTYNWDIRMIDGIPYLFPPAYLNREGTPIRLGKNRTREVTQRRRRNRRDDRPDKGHDGTRRNDAADEGRPGGSRPQGSRPSGSTPQGSRPRGSRPTGSRPRGREPGSRDGPSTSNANGTDPPDTG